MFKKKYMLIVGGALVFIVFIIGIVTVTFDYVKLNREWTLREFQDDIKAGSRQLQFYLESLHSDLLRIEKNLANNNMRVSKELYGYLDFVMGHHSNAIQEIFILDANGKVIARTNPASVQSSFHESTYFKNTQQIPNKVYLSEAITVSDLLHRSKGSPNVFIDPLDLGFVLHTGVYSKGIFKGAVLFLVRAEPFFNRYSMALTKLTSGYGFILQEDGRILFHRDVELRGKFTSDLPFSSDLIKAHDLLKKTDEKIVGYHTPGQHMIVTSEIYMANQRWILGISTTISKVAKKSVTTIYTISGMLLLFGIIIFGLIFSLIRLAQAKEMTGESEKRLRLMVDQVGAILWTVDSELRFTSSKGIGLEALKLKPDQVVGRTLYDYFQTDDPTFLPIEAHRNALNGESSTFDQTWNGVTFQTHVEPLRDTEGNILGVIGVSLNITERRRAEEALQQGLREMTILNAMGRKVGSSFSVDQVVQSALDGIFDPIKPDLALVFLRDKDMLFFKGDRYENPEFRHKDTLVHKVGECLCGLAVSEKNAIYSIDINNDPRCTWSECKEAGLISFAALPLRSGDEIIGVMGLASATKRDFSKQEIFLETVSNEIAVGLQNALFYEQLKDHTTKLEHEITERKRAEEVLRQSELRLRYLSFQLISAQEEERRRISLELHDEMGQALTAMGLNLESIGKELSPEDTVKIKGKLTETISLVEEASDRVRDLSLDLRPSMLDDLGIVPTLRWYVNSYEKRIDIPVIFEDFNLKERLAPNAEIVLYRIVQESLNNIKKHAQAKKVRIRLEQKKKMVTLIIKDDGIGFNSKRIMSETMPAKGIGLLGMRERVRLLGGRFSVRSGESKGTSIFVELPLQ